MTVSKQILSTATLATALLALTACGPRQAEVSAVDPADRAKLAALPAPYNTGDLDHGKALFAQCRSCHTVVKDGADMTGPNLHGVFGRKAGSKPGYSYSEKVRTAGFTWDAAHLDAWLAGPSAYMPGTKMTFLGFPDEKDRVDVIAYLKVESGYAP